jgi:hypothetical protein
MLGSRFGLALLAGFVVLSLQAGAFRPAAAQDREGPQLPGDCWSGELVVARAGGGFECMTVREALHLSSCSSGDFVTVESGGQLACVSPSHFDSGARALLPECSSGQTLVSEGFGRWKCVEPPH